MVSLLQKDAEGAHVRSMKSHLDSPPMAAEAGSIRPVLLLGAGFLILAAVGMGLWTGGWDVGKKRTDVDLQIESEEVGGSRGGGGRSAKGNLKGKANLPSALRRPWSKVARRAKCRLWQARTNGCSICLSGCQHSA